VKLLHALGFEWHSAIEHRKEDDACTPYVYVKPVALVPENFRRYVRWRATLLAHDLTFLDLP